MESKVCVYAVNKLHLLCTIVILGCHCCQSKHATTELKQTEIFGVVCWPVYRRATIGV